MIIKEWKNELLKKVSGGTLIPVVYVTSPAVL